HTLRLCTSEITLFIVRFWRPRAPPPVAKRARAGAISSHRVTHEKRRDVRGKHILPLSYSHFDPSRHWPLRASAPAARHTSAAFISTTSPGPSLCSIVAAARHIRIWCPGTSISCVQRTHVVLIDGGN